MKIIINYLDSGSYNLSRNKLSFDCSKFEITEIQFDNDIILEIDKKSALEITRTLLDSINLLNPDTENLLNNIEERIDIE